MRIAIQTSSIGPMLWVLDHNLMWRYWDNRIDCFHYDELAQDHEGRWGNPGPCRFHTLIPYTQEQWRQLLADPSPERLAPILLQCVV